MTVRDRTKVPVRLDEGGVVQGVSLADSVDVLERLYRRNWDHGSADFQSLTDVQARALYNVLSVVSKAKGKAARNSRLDLPPVPAEEAE